MESVSVHGHNSHSHSDLPGSSVAARPLPSLLPRKVSVSNNRDFQVRSGTRKNCAGAQQLATLLPCCGVNAVRSQSPHPRLQFEKLRCCWVVFT
jgi:hypothetical protein